MWPPQRDELKVDTSLEDGDQDDARLDQTLNAAVAYVERVHRGRVDFLDPPLGALPVPDADMVLGTLRLAARLHNRRRSPDGMVAAAELGSVRVGTGDADIDKLLRLGRWAPSVIA